VGDSYIIAKVSLHIQLIPTLGGRINTSTVAAVEISEDGGHPSYFSNHYICHMSGGVVLVPTVRTLMLGWASVVQYAFPHLESHLLPHSPLLSAYIA